MDHRVSDSIPVPSADQKLHDLVEEITDRLQAGEHVNADQILKDYPEYREQLLKLLPAVLAVEEFGIVPDQPTLAHVVSQDLPPRELGDYRILREIGRGGMGVVYEAEQISLRRHVALKVLPFAAVLDPRQLSRFKTEAQAAATLHHTNIVPVHGIGCERGVHYYAMQFIEGQSLAEVIRDLRLMDQGGRDVEAQKLNLYAEMATSLAKTKPVVGTAEPEAPLVMTAPQASSNSKADTSRESRVARPTQRSVGLAPYFRNVADLGIQVAEALDHAHAEGVIHRDIKPSNLLLEADGRVWVTDFGLARLESDPGMTMTGDLVGTLSYMSPEQTLAKRVVVDHRTDVYSLGVTLYELLTLHLPFDADGRQELLRQIAFDEPKPLRRWNRSIPEELETIVLKAMAKNPLERYATAGELAEDLRRYLLDQPIRARRPSWRLRLIKWRRRHKALVASAASIAIILLLATATIGIVMWEMEKQRTAERLQLNQRANDALTEAQKLAVTAQLSEENKLVLYSEARQAAERARTLSSEMSQEDTLQQRANELIGQLDQEVKKLTDSATQQDIARQQWIPEIIRDLQEDKVVAALVRTRQTAEVLPNDVAVVDLLGKVAIQGTVRTNPPGATLEARDWRTPESPWFVVGQTPLENVSLPRGPVRWRISLTGYCSREFVQEIEPHGELIVGLYRTTDVRPDMAVITPSDNSQEFQIDKYEVTNKAYQAFVDVGGYADPKFWKHGFVRDNSTLPFADAVADFVDTTGKPGPATWANGRFPPGEEDFPVRGVSWYEAAAFAEFQSKSLPTIDSWEAAAHLADVRFLLPVSNFSGTGPTPVGKSQGIGLYGIYDLAGNVSEWCLTPANNGRRCYRGGAWNDPNYLVNFVQTLSPWDRPETMGFRCALYRTEPVVVAYGPPAAALVTGDFSASPDDLENFKKQYEYNKDAPLNEKSIARDDSQADYIHETMEIDAAYGGERFAIHLYWPKSGVAPFQTVVFVPGAGSQNYDRFPESEYDPEMGIPREVALKSGRALCFPVFKGTFGRSDKGLGYEAATIMRAKDLFRTIDYLMRRPEVDAERLIYLGNSWGSIQAPVFLGLETRFAAGVLLGGGLVNSGTAATNPGHLAPFVKIPVLMLNGLDDELFPVDSSQKPLLNALGSQDKMLKNYPGKHGFDFDAARTDIYRWLTERLGPVVPQGDDPNLSPEQRMRQRELQAAGFLRTEKVDQAEAILKELLATRSSELGKSHRDTLRTERLLASILLKRKAYPQAIRAYKSVWERQRDLFGVDDADAEQTRVEWRDMCLGTGWGLTDAQNPTPQAYETALLLAKGYSDGNADPYFAHYLAARALVGSKSWSSALTELEASYAEDSIIWADHFLLEAISRWNTGQIEDAHDWYTAAQEYLRKILPGVQSIWNLDSQLSTLVGRKNGLNAVPPATELLAAYDRLISRHQVAPLYYRRGIVRARLGDWQQASDDFDQATRLNPRVFEYWQALACTRLYLNDLSGYQAACRSAIQRRTKNDPLNKILVILCSLGSSGIDAQQLSALADMTTLTFGESQADARLARALVAYRYGKLEDSVDMWPTDAGNRSVLSNVLLAAAHAKVGNAYTSRKLLDKGREQAARLLPSPDCPELTWEGEDVPIVWAMVQIALRESETIVARDKSAE